MLAAVNKAEFLGVKERNNLLCAAMLFGALGWIVQSEKSIYKIIHNIF